MLKEFPRKMQKYSQNSGETDLLSDIDSFQFISFTIMHFTHFYVNSKHVAELPFDNDSFRSLGIVN